MSTPGLMIVGVALVAGMAILVVGLRSPAQRSSVEDRLAELGTLSQGDLSLEDIELSLPFADRIIRPRLQDMAEFISRFTPTQTLTRTRQKLQLAGISNRIINTLGAPSGGEAGRGFASTSTSAITLSHSAESS